MTAFFEYLRDNLIAVGAYNPAFLRHFMYAFGDYRYNQATQELIFSALIAADYRTARTTTQWQNGGFGQPPTGALDTFGVSA